MTEKTINHKIRTIKELIQARKSVKAVNNSNSEDWELRKTNWLSSIQILYNKVDEIIIKNLEAEGIEVVTKKEKVRLFEDYVNSYEVENYSIKADGIFIQFFPIGTIIIGALGRVNMIVASETIKLVLTNWNEWKIITGMGSATKLIDFNEEEIVKLLQVNL